MNKSSRVESKTIQQLTKQSKCPQLLEPSPKIRQPKLSGRFQKITQGLDKSFTSHNQDLDKQNLNLSKVERKDTRQSEFVPSDLLLKNQQGFIVDKIDPIQNMIKKSQNDPFLRRKLMAVVDNDLKSLKRLNDQKSKPSSFSLKSLYMTQSVKMLPTAPSNAIDSQMSRLPKDISKIMDTTISRFSKTSLKKMYSQANILSGLQQNNPSQNSTLNQKKQQEQNQVTNFTTLRRESYIKKIQCLQLLRVVHDKQPQKEKKK